MIRILLTIIFFYSKIFLQGHANIPNVLFSDFNLPEMLPFPGNILPKKS